MGILLQTEFLAALWEDHTGIWVVAWSGVSGLNHGWELTEPCCLCWRCTVSLQNKLESWWNSPKALGWLVHTGWVPNYSTHSISHRPSNIECWQTQRDQTSSSWMGTMKTGTQFRMQKAKAMLCQLNWLLCQKVAFTAAWFSWTEIQCSKSHWGCWSPLHLPFKVSLWTQFYWVLLGCSQEIFAGTLWLHLWHTQDQPFKSPWLSWSQNHTEVGTSDDSLDGRLQRWEECKECSIWGKEVWLVLHCKVPESVAKTFDRPSTN